MISITTLELIARVHAVGHLLLSNHITIPLQIRLTERSALLHGQHTVHMCSHGLQPALTIYSHASQPALTILACLATCPRQTRMPRNLPSTILACLATCPHHILACLATCPRPYSHASQPALAICCYVSSVSYLYTYTHIYIYLRCDPIFYGVLLFTCYVCVVHVCYAQEELPRPAQVCVCVCVWLFAVGIFVRTFLFIDDRVHVCMCVCMYVCVCGGCRHSKTQMRVYFVG